MPSVLRFFPLPSLYHPGVILPLPPYLLSFFGVYILQILAGCYRGPCIPVAAQAGSQLPAPAISPAQCRTPPVPPLASSHLRCLEPAPDLRMALLSCPLPPPALVFSSDGGGGDSAQTSLCPLPVFRALHSTELKLVVERGGEKAALSTFMQQPVSCPPEILQTVAELCL